MWELVHKEGWAPKNWCCRIVLDCFRIVVLERTLESPLDSKEIKPVNPKGNHHEYSLKGLLMKLKLKYFSHLKWKANSLEKMLLLGKIEGNRRRGLQWIRWLDHITESMNVHLSKFQERVVDREAWCDAVPEAAKNKTQFRLSNNSNNNAWDMVLFLLWPYFCFSSSCCPFTLCCEHSLSSFQVSFREVYFICSCFICCVHMRRWVQDIPTAPSWISLQCACYRVMKKGSFFFFFIFKVFF